MQEEPTESYGDWISVHLYHYENLERVIRGFVQPLVGSLAAENSLTGFFFIRYGVGGPHVRLRLRPAEGARERVLDRMERSAGEFLAREPSTRALDPERIRRGTEAALKNDPHEVDASVYPDNSFHLLPFEPEIERYGGPSRIESSLDFFTLSSVAVLDHLSNLGEVGRSVRLAKAYELLLRQALAFAADGDELADLLRYGVDGFGGDAQQIVEKGEAVARAKGAHFLDLFLETLSEVGSISSGRGAREPSPEALFTLGKRRLSTALRDADRATRYRIGSSQVHMTASRLGLLNPEEVYLSRILSLVFEEVRTVAADELSELSELYRAEQGGTVRDLLPMALATLSGGGDE